MDYMKTGQLIAQARKARGMTQRDLANQLHLTDRAVSKWERGISFPDASVLESLSELLGLSLSQLITGDSDAVDAGESLEEGVRAFKQELKIKIRRTALLTVVIIAGIAIMIAIGCFLWRYVPAQRISLCEIPLTRGESEIAATNGQNAARFRIQLSPDVKKCQIIEETWSEDGLISSQKLWDISTAWESTGRFDIYADRWNITRKAVVTVGFSLSFEDYAYSWSCLTSGIRQQYNGKYSHQVKAMWSQTYRDLSQVRLSKDAAVPLMAAHLSNTVQDEFTLEGLQPGDPIPVMEDETVKILWLSVG